MQPQVISLTRGLKKTVGETFQRHQEQVEEAGRDLLRINCTYLNPWSSGLRSLFCLLKV